MPTYSRLIRDFIHTHAQYIRLSVAVTDTYTLSVWARMTGEAAAALARRSATKATRDAWSEEAERWQRTASITSSRSWRPEHPWYATRHRRATPTTARER